MDGILFFIVLMIIWRLVHKCIYTQELKGKRGWIIYIISGVIFSMMITLLQFYAFREQYGSLKDNVESIIIMSVCAFAVFIGYPIVRNKINAMSETK